MRVARRGRPRGCRFAADFAGFLFVAIPRTGRCRVECLQPHVSLGRLGVVAAAAGKSGGCGLPGSTRRPGRMARLAVADVLREGDIPVSTGNGVDRGIPVADRCQGVVQARSEMDGVHAPEHSPAPRPTQTRGFLALAVVARATLIHSRVIENLVVAQVVEHETCALRPPMALWHSWPATGNSISRRAHLEGHLRRLRASCSSRRRPFPGREDLNTGHIRTRLQVVNRVQLIRNRAPFPPRLRIVARRVLELDQVVERKVGTKHMHGLYPHRRLRPLQAPIPASLSRTCRGSCCEWRRFRFRCTEHALFCEAAH